MNEFKSNVPIFNFADISRTEFSLENFHPNIPAIVNIARIVFNFFTYFFVLELITHSSIQDLTSDLTSQDLTSQGHRKSGQLSFSGQAGQTDNG